MKVKLSSLVKLTEEKTIEGLAALPRVTRNGRFYSPKALEALDGSHVPLLWRHLGTPENVGDKIPADAIIGQATLTWNRALQQLQFKGQVKDEFAQALKQVGNLGASIGAHYKPETFHLSNGETINAATNLVIEELSLTPAASMPETYVKGLEEFIPDETACSKAAEDTADGDAEDMQVCPNCKGSGKVKKAEEEQEDKSLEGLDEASRIKYLVATGRLES